MKLAAVYCVWGDYDLNVESVKNLYHVVDGFINVYSEFSNFGEQTTEPYIAAGYNWEPDLSLPPVKNERAKRNYALNLAREQGYTHFLMLDADEFYEPSEFLKEKERFKTNPDLAGTVCRTKVYFKRPDLTIGYDTTLVPFIHRITPELRFEWNTRYPYAFEGPKKEIRIDPTRQMNINSGVEWSDITMHHMSYIRPDIHKKIRNSTARANIEHSTLVEDFTLAEAGYFCKFYGKTLEPCSDLFDLCSLPFIIEQRRSSIDSLPAQARKT